tara:strand:+ start:669 stop:1025 length:357 start_codon:yes stop_codon:yes gene_type:complete
MRHQRSVVFVVVFAIWGGAAWADPQITPQAAPEVEAQATEAATSPEDAAVVEETAEETAYLDQVVCRAVDRPASRLQSRRRVCDTRRAWRDMEAAAVAETMRLINMGQYNNRDRQPGR